MTERAGWFATHPVTQEQVHVVTREWFDEEAAELRRLRVELENAFNMRDLADEKAGRLRTLTGTVVEAWTRWIDTRKPEWAYEPEDPATEELDEAVGALGRVAVPERYDA